MIVKWFPGKVVKCKNELIKLVTDEHQSHEATTINLFLAVVNCFAFMPNDWFLLEDEALILEAWRESNGPEINDGRGETSAWLAAIHIASTRESEEIYRENSSSKLASLWKLTQFHFTRNSRDSKNTQKMIRHRLWSSMKLMNSKTLSNLWWMFSKLFCD